MDVDISVQDEFDDENDTEEMIMCENEDKSRIESDSESSTPDNI